MVGLSDADLDQSLWGMHKVLRSCEDDDKDVKAIRDSYDIAIKEYSVADKRRRLFVQLAFFIDQHAAPLKRNALDGLNSGPFFSLLSAKEHADLSPPFDPKCGSESNSSTSPLAPRSFKFFEGPRGHRMFDPFSSHLCRQQPDAIKFTKWRIAIFVWVRCPSFLMSQLVK